MINRIVVVGVVAVIVSACGSSGRLLGQTCEKTSSGLSARMCEAPLLCRTSDVCPGSCEGTCVKRCMADTECPQGCTCSGTLSAENGGPGKVCAGLGCQ